MLSVTNFKVIKAPSIRFAFKNRTGNQVINYIHDIIFFYTAFTPKKLSCLKSGAEFDMNDILYEFKNLHHF